MDTSPTHHRIKWTTSDSVSLWILLCQYPVSYDKRTLEFPSPSLNLINLFAFNRFIIAHDVISLVTVHGVHYIEYMVWTHDLLTIVKRSIAYSLEFPPDLSGH